VQKKLWKVTQTYKHTQPLTSKSYVLKSEKYFLIFEIPLLAANFSAFASLGIYFSFCFKGFIQHGSID
jgi:hypothetical protein